MIQRGWKRWNWFPCWERREWPGSGRTLCVWMMRGKILHRISCDTTVLDATAAENLDFWTNFERLVIYTENYYFYSNYFWCLLKETKCGVETFVSVSVHWNRIPSTSWSFPVSFSFDAWLTQRMVDQTQISIYLPSVINLFKNCYNVFLA